jgi:hypothetical protein
MVPLPNGPHPVLFFKQNSETYYDGKEVNAPVPESLVADN